MMQCFFNITIFTLLTQITMFNVNSIYIHLTQGNVNTNTIYISTFEYTNNNHSHTM